MLRAKRVDFTKEKTKASNAFRFFYKRDCAAKSRVLARFLCLKNNFGFT